MMVFVSPLTTVALLLLSTYLFLHCSPGKGALTANLKKNSIYRGEQYWKTGVTLDVTTLYETPFSRFQLHKVKIGDKIIDDWLWYDESDNVNILVQNEEGNFLVFKQTKYAWDGESLAVVGGLIESGEEPLEAAKRELMEELGMEARSWDSLGSYRAACNRGGGITHTFFARDAKKSLEDKKAVVGQADLERQDLIYLTKRELLDAVLDGKFQEIKWTATVALALLKQNKFRINMKIDWD